MLWQERKHFGSKECFRSRVGTAFKFARSTFPARRTDRSGGRRHRGLQPFVFSSSMLISQDVPPVFRFVYQNVPSLDSHLVYVRDRFVVQHRI